MANAQKYSGGCHCGKVRYDVTTELGTVIACNCSICSKKAHLLTFVPEDAFTLISGDGELADYQFNKHNIHHLFCRTCGISSFARGAGPDGKPMVSINVRCLEGVNVDDLKVHQYDGASV
jgi:hypothetical protein